MARKLEVTLVGDSASLERAFGRAGRSASGFERGISTASKGVSIGLLAIGVGAKKAGDDASALGESINAVNVVFGKAADRIHAFSKTAATEAGLSARAFNELVTPIGAALQNVGYSADEAAVASINLGKRAADMASVFNVDVSEALEAIQAGLRGEADPLERFGVGLSDAAVKAKAMALGLADTEAGLTANDKAQARLALVMSQTNKLAGDFTNTSDQLANSTRINTAAAENQRAKLGEGVLPVMTTLQSLYRSVTTVMGEHTTATKVVTIAVVALGSAVLAVNAGMKVYTATTIAATAAQGALNIAMRANPIGLVITALVALGVALVVAYKKSETFRNVVDAAFSHAKLAVALILGPLGLVIYNLDRIRSAAYAAADAIRSIPDVASKTVGFSGIDLIKKIGGRAAGGPVASGTPYIVGERGPELFVPGRSGTIIPNGGTTTSGGTGGGDVIFNIGGQEFARVAWSELLRLKGRNAALELG